MNNAITFAGLDVHARSIKACAFVPATGEVENRSFGYVCAVKLKSTFGTAMKILDRKKTRAIRMHSAKQRAKTIKTFARFGCRHF